MFTHVNINATTNTVCACMFVLFIYKYVSLYTIIWWMHMNVPYCDAYYIQQLKIIPTKRLTCEFATLLERNTHTYITGHCQRIGWIMA